MSNANTGMSYSGSAIQGVATSLSGALTQFKAQVEIITSTIDGMSQYWSGAAYQAFKTETDTYRRNELEPMIKNLESWVTKLGELGSAATTAQTNNTSLFGS